MKRPSPATSLASRCPWLPAAVLAVGGLALAAAGQTALLREDQLASDRNPFAVQGSAYGRLLARLSEETVDRVWHLGVEQVVPHHISGDEHDEAHGLAVAEEDEEEAGPSGPIEMAKERLGQMRFVKFHRTNPYSLSERHLASVKREIEGMLLRSYRMDPGHLGS